MSWDTGDVCMYIDTRDVLGRLGILEELYLINLSIGNFQSKGTKSEGVPPSDNKHLEPIRTELAF